MAPTAKQRSGSAAAGGKHKAVGAAAAAPKKARVHRYLKSTEAQLVETRAKSTLLLKGFHCSQAMATVLKDLRAMQAPHCKLLTKKNAIVPFDHDGQQSLEFLTTKNDCTLFCMASHNKKRPNSLTIGRTFDRQMLDILQLAVLYYKSLANYGGSVPKKRIGSKPLMLFVGDLWQHDATYRKLQNLLIDLYRGDPVDKLVASGVDHVMVFSVAMPPPSIQQPNTQQQQQPIVHQRTYFVKLKQNPNGNSKVPLPYLQPCGPDMDLQVRRTQFANADLYKASLQQPSRVAARRAGNNSNNKKNQSTNVFGETMGRLHLERQHIDKMQGRKAKALKRAEKIEAQEEEVAVDRELEREGNDMQLEFKQAYGFDEQETM